jgi:hypothetical protein
MKANETQLRQTFSVVQINRGQTKHSARNRIQMDGRRAVDYLRAMRISWSV